MNTITNYDNIIDSRDIIEQIAALTARQEDDDLDDEERAELAALLSLQAEAEGYCPDWKRTTLIRDSYFEQYARETAEEIGAMRVVEWPYNCIDWEKAAKALQQDYTAVDFDGVMYWVR